MYRITTAFKRGKGGAEERRWQRRTGGEVHDGCGDSTLAQRPLTDHTTCADCKHATRLTRRVREKRKDVRRRTEEVTKWTEECRQEHEKRGAG